ncbi:hypothetical protein GPX89_08410 [Nocardia sp. ET3-3]|uniref:DUF3558 domain-containing protein n=1 Tax=Nocardia terrae TaxID=2675851 RepID=A0A7K1USE5_9NOCA|nr:hypothetical protein [Nocardia terrae]MVU77267.1 hypothetical protein [Nocardia terrae]
MRKHLVRIVIAVMAVAGAAGCSSDSKGSGALDPCRQIEGPAVQTAGFDPRTKLIKDDIDGTPARECTYTSSVEGMLRIDLLTDGYDKLLSDARAKAAANGRAVPTVSVINKRDAFTHAEEIDSDDKSIPLGCSTTLRADTGAVKIDVLPHVEDLTRTDDACTTVLRVATTLEPSLANH